MNSNRSKEAGVTLIEMLVVLALFAVVSGAVILALPEKRGRLGAEVQAQTLAQALNTAVDHTLRTGQGFAIRQNNDHLSLEQQDLTGVWVPHNDAYLASLKLFVPTARILKHPGQDYVVSAALVPDSSDPFVATFGRGKERITVVYDGARARVVADGEQQNCSRGIGRL